MKIVYPKKVLTEWSFSGKSRKLYTPGAPNVLTATNYLFLYFILIWINVAGKIYKPPSRRLEFSFDANELHPGRIKTLRPDISSSTPNENLESGWLSSIPHVWQAARHKDSGEVGGKSVLVCPNVTGETSLNLSFWGISQPFHQSDARILQIPSSKWTWRMKKVNGNNWRESKCRLQVEM